MKPSIARKLDALQERFEEVSGLLSDPTVIAKQDQFRELSQEYARIDPVVKTYDAYRRAHEDLLAAEEMSHDPEPEIRELGDEERKVAAQRCENLEIELQKHLVPSDPNDGRNTYLEIRAGTGGDDPRRGVADRNCRVHGIDNLYITGSSVFPTSGAANPTLTIVALTLRLADHLKSTRI